MGAERSRRPWVRRVMLGLPVALCPSRRWASEGVGKVKAPAERHRDVELTTRIADSDASRGEAGQRGRGATADGKAFGVLAAPEAGILILRHRSDVVGTSLDVQLESQESVSQSNLEVLGVLTPNDERYGRRIFQRHNESPLWFASYVLLMNL